jgi:hypothetical protein
MHKEMIYILAGRLIDGSKAAVQKNVDRSAKRGDSIDFQNKK